MTDTDTDRPPAWMGPAHRHTNPDGTQGGWVADTATVGGNARVYGNARVSGNARVYGNARVSGNAWVGGNARVYGNARVSGNARVYGNARVDGDAWVADTATVGGDARVERTRHVVTVGPVGSEHRTVTIYRTADGHQIVAGCWQGTVDELEARIAPGGNHGWPTETEHLWRADYQTVCALAHARIHEWEAQP